MFAIAFCSRLNTVVPSQLFAALQNRSAVNVTTLFEAWTTQPGYPLITVTVDEKRQSMTITQKKFTRSGEQREYKNTTWNVPLNIATADDNEDFSNTRTRFVLKQGDIGLNISLPKGIQWIIFNVQQTGEPRNHCRRGQCHTFFVLLGRLLPCELR